MSTYNEIDNRLSILEDYVDDISNDDVYMEDTSTLTESEVKNLLLYVALEDTYGLDTQYFEEQIEHQIMLEGGGGVSSTKEVYSKIKDIFRIVKTSISEAKKLKKSGDKKGASNRIDDAIKSLQELRTYVKNIEYGLSGWILCLICENLISTIKLMILIGKVSLVLGGTYALIHSDIDIDEETMDKIYTALGVVTLPRDTIGRILSLTKNIINFIRKINDLEDDLKNKRSLTQIINPSRDRVLRYIDEAIRIVKVYKLLCIN